MSGAADRTRRCRDPQLRIALEAESFEFHALPEAFSYAATPRWPVQAGWSRRFTWDDVIRSAYVAAVITDLVALRARS